MLISMDIIISGSSVTTIQINAPCSRLELVCAGEDFLNVLFLTLQTSASKPDNNHVREILNWKMFYFSGKIESIKIITVVSTHGFRTHFLNWRHMPSNYWCLERRHPRLSTQIVSKISNIFKYCNFLQTNQLLSIKN